jgi:hypothetical protein
MVTKSVPLSDDEIAIILQALQIAAEDGSIYPTTMRGADAQARSDEALNDKLDALRQKLSERADR